MADRYMFSVLKVVRRSAQGREELEELEEEAPSVPQLPQWEFPLDLS